jgi:hypothetical protein
MAGVVVSCAATGVSSCGARASAVLEEDGPDAGVFSGIASAASERTTEGVSIGSVDESWWASIEVEVAVRYKATVLAVAAALRRFPIVQFHTPKLGKSGYSFFV